MVQTKPAKKSKQNAPWHIRNGVSPKSDGRPKKPPRAGSGVPPKPVEPKNPVASTGNES